MCHLLLSFMLLAHVNGQAQEGAKGKLLYQNNLATATDTAGWVMEGPAELTYTDGWMHMQSPNEAGHHVLWCPQEFPTDFVAEWEVQNHHPEAGLCIVFFAARGINGEDILDTSLPARNGVFTQYTKGAINNYHISYYADGENQPDRGTANLRKNKGFRKVQTGAAGIPLNSVAVHTVRLTKYQGHITLYIDDRKIIDWTDDGQQYGEVLGGGKIGFRQMKWTHFAYRNFKVWEAVPQP